jgi:cytochrome P450 StaP
VTTAFAIDPDRSEANVARNVLPRFDPACDPAVDPDPVYAEYRERDPVHWGLPHDPRLPGLWCLFRHAECSQLFRLGIEAPGVLGGMPSKLGWQFSDGSPAEARDYFEMRKSFLTAQDPPDHTRIRRVVGQFFTPRRVEECRPRVQSLVTALIDGILERGPGPFEFVEALAYPLPLMVISDLMGVPIEDREIVHELSANLGRGFDVDGSFSRVVKAAEAARGFRTYLGPMFEARRQEPRADIITTLVQSCSQATGLAEPELYGVVSILIQGGQSTTMGLLSGGLLGLLQQRDQFEQLGSDPDRLSVPATEELLRWVSPAQAPPPRWAYQDFEIGGQVIRRGEAVQAMIGSANYDPAVFTDPARIDITRVPNPHLGFGGGVHRCLGSTLARLQGQMVFRDIVTRMPNVELDPAGSLVYLDRRVVRSVTRLPLILA